MSSTIDRRSCELISWGDIGRALTGYCVAPGLERAYHLAACAMNRDTNSIAATSIGSSRAIRKPRCTSLGISATALDQASFTPAVACGCGGRNQETFPSSVRAVRQPGGIQSPGGFGSFVNSVCNNVLFELYRSHSRVVPLGDENGAKIVDPRAGSEESVVLEEERALVSKVLETLLPKERS